MINVERTLYWIPRVLVFLFVIFMAAFALDVFQEDLPLGDTVLAMLIHLVPAGIVIVALIVAWHREVLGGALFIALALGYVWSTGARAPVLTYVLVAGPPVLIGVLFWSHHLYTKRSDAEG